MQNSPGKIADEVSNLLKQFENIDISLDLNKKVNLLDDLRNSPRVGFLVRAKKSKIPIDIPSVYNHINKLGVILDVLICEGSYNFDNKILASLCAYHDLAESIIGDIPAFTSRDLSGDYFLEQNKKVGIEKEANKQIINALEGRVKKDYQYIMKLYHEGVGDEFKREVEFFRFADKLEAILTLWQYIFQQRDKIGNIRDYIKTMEDFFGYPLKRLSIDDLTLKTAKFLQDRIKLEDYYYKGREVFYEAGYYDQNYTFLLPLIEKLPVAG